MTDKERVLLTIIKSFYVKHILSSLELFDKCKTSEIRTGDLVLAMTSGVHDFTVGYVTKIDSESEMSIREIGSNKICNIGNEQFYKIPFDILINENNLLEGNQYLIYEKVLKAFHKYGGYNNRFHSIEFDDCMCKVKSREAFSNKVKNEVNFKYNSKTTVKSIGELIRE